MGATCSKEKKIALLRAEVIELEKKLNIKNSYISESEYRESEKTLLILIKKQRQLKLLRNF